MKLKFARENMELVVLGVITLVVALNSTFLASLSINRTGSWQLIDTDIFWVFVAYALFLILSLLFIALKKARWIKTIFYGFLILMTAHIFYNLYNLILNPVINHTGELILLDAFIIYVTSLLTFSLWYWVVDRGGPFERALNPKLDRHDFHFAQYGLKDAGWGTWQPRYIDYLSMSFFVATNFSAADVVPLSRSAKVLVMIQAGLSLIIIAMVITRAISLL